MTVQELILKEMNPEIQEMKEHKYALWALLKAKRKQIKEAKRTLKALKEVERNLGREYIRIEEFTGKIEAARQRIFGTLDLEDIDNA